MGSTGIGIRAQMRLKKWQKPVKLDLVFFAFLAWERVCLLVSEPRLRRSDRAWYSLEFPVIARFTRLQFALAVVIFFVTEVPVIGMTFPLFIAALVFVRTKYLPKKYDARTLELIDPLIDLAPIDKTPSTADLLEEGTPPSSPAPQVAVSYTHLTLPTIYSV